jgi:hypothetical protein
MCSGLTDSLIQTSTRIGSDELESTLIRYYRLRPDPNTIPHTDLTLPSPVANLAAEQLVSPKPQPLLLARLTSYDQLSDVLQSNTTAALEPVEDSP